MARRHRDFIIYKATSPETMSMGMCWYISFYALQPSETKITVVDPRPLDKRKKSVFQRWGQTERICFSLGSSYLPLFGVPSAGFMLK